MRAAWHIVSLISHPLLMVTYGLVLMLLSNPFLFGATSILGKVPLIAIVLFSTFLIPILSIGMMRALNLIESFDMPDRRDRVAPLFSTGIWYAALYFNISRANIIPPEFGMFLFGMMASLFMCLFINSFYKISLHATGVAGLVLGLFTFYFSGNAEALAFSFGHSTIRVHFIAVALLALLFAGLSSSGRMYEKEHTFDQIVAGWMVGIAGQVFALYF